MNSTDPHTLQDAINKLESIGRDYGDPTAFPKCAMGCPSAAVYEHNGKKYCYPHKLALTQKIGANPMTSTIRSKIRRVFFEHDFRYQDGSGNGKAADEATDSILTTILEEIDKLPAMRYEGRIEAGKQRKGYLARNIVRSEIRQQLNEWRTK